MCTTRGENKTKQETSKQDNIHSIKLVRKYVRLMPVGIKVPPIEFEVDP